MSDGDLWLLLLDDDDDEEVAAASAVQRLRSYGLSLFAYCDARRRQLGPTSQREKRIRI